jgi:arsenical pump membrane protein
MTGRERRAPATAGTSSSQSSLGFGGRWGWLLGGVGLLALAGAAVANPTDARAAAAQDWSPFVLVTGLLLIGLVADRDGLFAAAGHWLARSARSGPALYIGATLMVGLVTALLNLDTSVAFLTPILVYAARSRGGGEAPLLYGCLLLSNAASLFLPGSNLTNLIVLGHFSVRGATFLAQMWAPALAALVVTALVVAIGEHRAVRLRLPRPAQVSGQSDGPVIGLGLVAIVISTACMLALRSPALPVLIVGLVAVGQRIVTGREDGRRAVGLLGLPILVGLFGVAVALGTLGRSWAGPETLLSHLNLWGTAAVAAVCSVLVNNLPAASLLAARTPDHPYALLIGLNLGPNLFVTGSLAWLLWLRTARSADAHPSIAHACRLGAVAVPLSMVAALLVLSR